MSIFKLGYVDKGSMPADKAAFLAPYHATMTDELKKRVQFRDEVNGEWNNFVEVSDLNGFTIRQLQQFLKEAGFMPKSNMDGVFGYATQASVRLFQEYIRTIEGNPSIPNRAGIGVPDGVAGPTTLDYVRHWQQTKAGTPEFVCEWGRSSVQKPSAEYLQWLMLLGKAKAHFTANPSPILQLIDNFPQTTDTRKVSEWDVRPETIHLIGIRRNQEISTTKRENDDLFILLINGMVFKFWGSTDPNPELASPSGHPFLIEGQHNYQFGWHKTDDAVKIYRALRPASNGVLVYRAPAGVKFMNDENVLKGLDKNPNRTINIHWSGFGGYNFSAGCQVIAGQSYINNNGDLIDCSSFASESYSGLGGKPPKTRGAYNLFADLVLSYAPLGVQTIAYTLGRDKTLSLSDKDTEYVGREVSRLRWRPTKI